MDLNLVQLDLIVTIFGKFNFNYFYEHLFATNLSGITPIEITTEHFNLIDH